MVEVVLNGCRVQMLVNTGSSTRVLPRDRFVTDQVVHTTLRTATDAPLEIDGTLECQMVIDGWAGKHTFCVGEVTMPVLGMDFLRRHDAVVEAKSGRLLFKDFKD